MKKMYLIACLAFMLSGCSVAPKEPAEQPTHTEQQNDATSSSNHQIETVRVVFNCFHTANTLEQIMHGHFSEMSEIVEVRFHLHENRNQGWPGVPHKKLSEPHPIRSVIDGYIPAYIRDSTDPEELKNKVVVDMRSGQSYIIDVVLKAPVDEINKWVAEDATIERIENMHLSPQEKIPSAVCEQESGHENHPSF